MNLKTLLTIIFVIVISKNLQAQNDSDIGSKVADNVANIMRSKKPVTKKDYDKFWNLMGVKSKEQKLSLISIMRPSFVDVQDFNALLWSCAEKSWIEKQQVKCDNLYNKFEYLKKTLSTIPNDQKIKDMEKNFKYIIIAAANQGKIPPEYQNDMDFPDDLTLDKIKSAARESQIMLLRANALLQLEFLEK